MKPLPYFDILIPMLEAGHPDMTAAFNRHMHWGYWDYPRSAGTTPADLGQAAERLTRLVCDAGDCHDGLRVLDAGCGFGGTIGSLNERFDGNQLVGLNIESRQLDRARAQILPRGGNSIEWVHGDACRMPFESGVFDRVLAVECIFHFPSRRDFFQEVARILRPGGRLAICDFVPRGVIPPLAGYRNDLLNRFVERTYGPIELCTLACYERYAREAGLRVLTLRDITVNTLPTYRIMKPLMLNATPGWRGFEALLATRLVEWVSRMHGVPYLILTWEKPAGHG